MGRVGRNTHSGLFTVATFRSWRGSKELCRTGPDPFLWIVVICKKSENGAGRDRTDGLHIANVALSQLSYCPKRECRHNKSTAHWQVRTAIIR